MIRGSPWVKGEKANLGAPVNFCTQVAEHVLRATMGSVLSSKDPLVPPGKGRAGSAGLDAE